MPKLAVSIDGVIVKEAQLTKERSTLGRRPYNDIVLDDLAVSGEHAAVSLRGGEVWIEDLGSTNGTFLDGQSIKNQKITPDNVIQIGKCQLKLIGGAEGQVSALHHAATMPAGVAARGPRVRVLNGSAAGRVMELTKVVTRVGKPGVSVASITRRPDGFELATVEGAHKPTLNNAPLQGAPVRLKNHDQIDLGGVRLEFLEG
jgi:pSer/pThr/pTyr-binding forkhead associated (FHA) protein